eukprot:Mycagemm_TRINITY_DN9445_c0_g1::TRINITY_DN9445_c0_g1_i1::g.3004::m.3004 type:complete len:127 gc:universal TRINITY_DN9445_c0_g1_i1:368-748(+)
MVGTTSHHYDAGAAREQTTWHVSELDGKLGGDQHRGARVDGALAQVVCNEHDVVLDGLCGPDIRSMAPEGVNDSHSADAITDERLLLLGEQRIAAELALASELPHGRTQAPQSASVVHVRLTQGSE